MKHKLKIIIFSLLFIISFFCLSGCEEPTVTPEGTNTATTDIPPPETTVTEKNETPIIETPTPTPTPEDTSDPRYDSENAIGPFTFGENTYKVYIGETLVFFNTDKTVFFELEGVSISNKELFALTVSFIDLNFDEIPDFSYFEPDGRRICYLANSEGNGYTYSSELSNLYKLSRCYETAELYASVTDNSDEYYSYKFVDGRLVQGEALSDKFAWDIRAISDALAGEDAAIIETEETDIRGIMCKTYTVGGYITVATDSYGNFYIKDMPHRGFCRLSLNPNGRWSKSEKVTADMF